MKVITEDRLRANRIYSIVVLALFLFVFLGMEYLFDNCMAMVTDASGVVVAQSYILAASVIGFVLFPVLYRRCNTYGSNCGCFLCNRDHITVYSQ